MDWPTPQRRFVVINTNQATLFQIESVKKERDVMQEECLKLLALYQPVAGDLRFLVAVIKINSELERIGDLASNIGEAPTVVEISDTPAAGSGTSALAARPTTRTKMSRLRARIAEERRSN